MKLNDKITDFHSFHSDINIPLLTYYTTKKITLLKEHG